MKYLLILLLFPCSLLAQPCADEDTVRNNAATLITANTARINGTTTHFFGGVLSIQLRYVRVGFTDTATASASGTNPLRNLSGLQPNTTYRYYYKSICGTGTNQQHGVYTFTTLAATVVYATERSTVFPYTKNDSGFVLPRVDTALYKQAGGGGNVVFKPGDSLFYGFNGARWVPFTNSTSGISNKVDSVTVYSDSLFYWINGVAYGYILPNGNAWFRTGNAGTTAGTNFLGTTDNVDIVFKRNSVESGRLGTSNTAFGVGAGTGNSQNTAVGTNALTLGTAGNNNTAIGYAANSQAIPTGTNTAIGAASLLNSSATQNTALGVSALQSSTTGQGNIGIGYTAGKYNTTQSFSFYVNSIDRTNILGDTTKSIIYGYQNASAANQRLYLNSQLLLPYAASQANAADSMMVILPSNGKVGYRSVPTSGGTVGGDPNYLTRVLTTGVIGNSAVYQNGSNVGVGTITASQKLDVLGNIKFSGELDNIDTTTGSTGLLWSNYRPINYGTSYGARGVQMGYNSGYGLFNVNASGRPNVVSNYFMYNATNAGGRVNTNEASFRFAAENHYEMLGGKNYFEIHPPEVTTSTGTVYRPLSMYLGKDSTADSFIQSLVPSWEWFSGNANTGSYFAINGSKSSGVWSMTAQSPNSSSGVKFSGNGSSAITSFQSIPTGQDLYYTNWANSFFGGSSSKLFYTTSTNLLSNTNISGTLIKSRTSSTDSIMFDFGSLAYKAGIIVDYGSGEIKHFAQSGGYFQTFYHSNSQAFRTISGGISGSSSSGGSFNVSSTSDATKGKINFGTSAYDEANNRLGIGTTTPDSALTVINGVRFARGVRFSAMGTGTLTSDANGVISSVSDKRLKNVLGNYNYGLEAVMKLEPKMYHWNEKSGLDTKGIYVGLIAQNAKENLPYSTGENADGYLSLADRTIMAALINSVKELKAMNDKQQKEIDNLKKQIKK